MSKRIDNIVNALTNCIEEQIQTEVETALGVKHRKLVLYVSFVKTAVRLTSLSIIYKIIWVSI